MNLQKKLLYELGEKYIKEKGNLWLKVISPSMTPLIHVGDKVLAESIMHKDISIGDVIIFKGENNQFITHRIICKRRINGRLYFLEKGDRINIATWIYGDSIIAKVKAIKRKDNTVVRLDNCKITMFTSKLFALYQLSGYVFEKKISSFKDRANGHKTISFIIKPCEYSYKIIKRGMRLSKKLFNPMFVKVMNLSG